ncbi:MAG: endonuclease/exonuclease/phosphatase family protein [Verrucomicrobia bacterium]|nr:endonuclease/exonuclease/phosphatase family protein [Verrucomicrobiota bacterium]
MDYRRKLSLLLVGASLALHLATVFCFSRQPGWFAAFTAFPLWFWGGIGLAMSATAFCLLHARLSMVLSAIWAITILVGSDEAVAIGNLGKDAPLPGPAIPHHGRPVLRVATLNCSRFNYGNPALDLARWQPDIVLLQEAYPHQVRQIADVLYQRRGDYRSHNTNGIVTRWRIGDKGYVFSGLRDHHVPVILPSGASIEVVNVHLSSAATDLRLWQPSAWRIHRENRATRRAELGSVVRFLDATFNLPETPIILGGDFNSGASDPVHNLLVRDFTDAFAAAGTGWGDTYQRRVPILRIDHIYANRHFTPIRCRAVTTTSSDHRIVIADFLTEALAR